MNFDDIFVFVIANFGNTVYDEMIRMLKLQFKKYNISHMFLYDSVPPPGNTVLDKSDIIFSKPTLTHNTQSELNPYMIMKFLAGLHLINENKYKYIIRVNVSTFIDFQQLISVLSNDIPLTKFAGGHLMCFNIPDWSIDHVDPYEFISGTCMIFSKDVIEFLKTKKLDDPLYYTHNDDVIISYLVKTYCDSISKISMSWSDGDKCCLYRIKYEDDRNKDIVKWASLLNSIDSIYSV